VEITKTEIIEYFNGRVSYMLKHHEQENGRHQRIKKSLSQFVRSGMSVLDVGCGTGVTSRHTASLGAEVTGVDIAPELIECARQHSNGLNITYLVQDAGDLDLPCQFDAVIMADVFEHFPRKDAFQKVWRILKTHTHESSYVYLNMPSFEFAAFMQERYPEKLQIIDEAWKMDDILSLFRYWSFVPISVQVYGIDAPGQYVEYLFIHSTALGKTYQDRMEQIYGGTNERKENPD